MVVSRVMTSCAPTLCASKRVRRRQKLRVASQQEAIHPLIVQMLNDANEQQQLDYDVNKQEVAPYGRDVMAVWDTLQDLNANRRSMLHDYVTDQMLRAHSHCCVNKAHVSSNYVTMSRSCDVIHARGARSWESKESALRVRDVETRSEWSSELTSVTSDVTSRRSRSDSSSSDDVSMRDVQQFVEFVRYEDACRKRRGGRRRRSALRQRKFICATDITVMSRV